MPILARPRRRSPGLLTLSLVALGAVAVLALKGCGNEEKCLVHGENCTQAYKQAHYGTTSIQCCQGQCTDKGSGVLTCG